MYISISNLKECNFFFVFFTTLNNTNLKECNFELGNIFWRHLIAYLKVLLYNEEWLVSSNLNSKQLRCHGVRPSIDRSIKDCTETASFAENLLEGKVSDIFSRMPHCRKVKIFTIKWNKSLERHFYSAWYYHLHIF